MHILSEHSLRYRLNNEVHSRPYIVVEPPVRISYLAMLSDAASVDKERSHVRLFAERNGMQPPTEEATHYTGETSALHFKWERHAEFSSYTFICQGKEEEPFSDPAINQLPDDWLSDLEGEVLVGVHLACLPDNGETFQQRKLSRFFLKESLVGSHVIGGAAQVWSDFRLHKDAFTRMLVLDKNLSQHQPSRLVQNLLDMETYRMMALLGLPLVGKYGPLITQMGQRLTKLTQQMAVSKTLEDERALLEELTVLEAEIETINAESFFRFSATKAYNTIFNDSFTRIMEERIDGTQRLSRFLLRRHNPAIKSCESVSSGLENLSGRVARASQILLTRVDLALESQNRDLLHSMDSRAQLQMRLQDTVEGLSIAAMTYYIVGMIGYLVKALNRTGFGIVEDLFVGFSVPIVALFVWLGVRTVKKRLVRNQDSD